MPEFFAARALRRARRRRGGIVARPMRRNIPVTAQMWTTDQVAEEPLITATVEPRQYHVSFEEWQRRSREAGMRTRRLMQENEELMEQIASQRRDRKGADWEV